MRGNICYATEVKGYMTLAQLAQHLGITAATLRQQVARGVLYAEKSGRDWFVTEEEAARYEREHAGRPGAASPRHPKRNLGRKALDVKREK